MDHQRERRPEQERNRLEVLERVERHVLDQRGIGGERARRGEQRVTVRRRVGNGGGGNVAAGADAVLDDDRLAEPLLKFGNHCAHHDDEGDRSGRELLSEATATERKEACQRGRNQNGTTCDHRSLPSDARTSIRTIPGRVRRCATWTRPPPRRAPGRFLPVRVEHVRSGLNPASSIILAQHWGAGPSGWVFPWERGSPAALPRQPPFASELLQMVLACYASWQHRKESTDAQSLHWLLQLRGLPTARATTSKPRGKAAKKTRRGKRLRGPHSRSLNRKSIGLTRLIAAVTAR